MADQDETTAPAAADMSSSQECQPLLDTGMKDAVKYMAATFLDEGHYKKIHQSMSTRGDKLQSLSAAMKLMHRYGVVLTPKEEERLQGMEESQQINALVMKMPQQSNDQFQQFFLQLQLLVSTATRVRQNLEEGRTEQVKEALDDAESMGIAPYILQMAIVQAGAEVTTTRKVYTQWIRDTDSKMGKLVRGQEDAMSAQKRLAAAQAQLGNFTTSQNEKAKKMVMNFAAGSTKGLVTASFTGWSQYTKQAKKEAVIRVEFEARIQIAEDTLVKLKQEQLAKSNGMMARKAAESGKQLVQFVLRMWWEEVDDAKTQGLQAEMLKELEEKLKKTQGDQAANTKRVMARMQGESEASLVSMCFKAFITFHQDYQKNKELEDSVKAAEGKVQGFLKNKNEGAKKVLENMSSGTDAGLVHTCFQYWVELRSEALKEAELQEIMAKGQAKMGMFSSKNKASGMSAMERAKYALDQMVMLRAWGAWKLVARMDAGHRQCQDKVEAKRQQLYGVHRMFRKFATQLETSVHATQQETTRDARGQRMIQEIKADNADRAPKHYPSKEHQLSKVESLPDINGAKPNSGRKMNSGTRGGGGQSRTPTSVSGGNAYPAQSYPAAQPAEGPPPQGPRTAWG